MGAMRPIVFVALWFGTAATGSNERNPLGLVVNLIKELKEKIEKDGKTEDLMYSKMACWCETFTKDKADAVHKGQEELANLANDINTNKGNIATFASDVNDLMLDISENQAKQYEETTKRERQNADYMQNAAELTNAVNALDKATTMLGGVDPLALLQGTFKLSSSQASVLRALKPAVAKAVLQLPADKLSKVKAPQLSALDRLGETHAGKFQPFEPTITAIMKDLYESFKATQDTENSNEADLQASYEELMAAKAEGLQTKQAMLKEKEESKARESTQLTSNEKLWQTTADEMREANRLFGLAKSSCTNKADQYNARKEARNKELEGVEEALELLTSDENRALLGKSSADTTAGRAELKSRGLDFLQVDMDNDVKLRRLNAAYGVLRRAARGAKSFRLAQIAARVFERATRRQFGRAESSSSAAATEEGWQQEVTDDIDGMLADLKTDQQHDTETHDNCKEEEHVLNLEIDNRTHIVKRYQWKLDKLNSKVEDLQASIDKTAEEVQDIVKMQVSTEQERQSETTEYENQKADDEAAITVLTSAIGKMSKFYQDENIDMGPLNAHEAPAASLLQKGVPQEDDEDIFLQWEQSRQHGHMHLHGRSLRGTRKKHHKHGKKSWHDKASASHEQPSFEPTADDMIKSVDSHEFSDKSSSAGASKGIIGLLTNIKQGLESDVQKATQEEDKAQADFEDLISSSTGEKEDLADKIVDYRTEKEDKESEVDDNEQWKQTEQAELDSVNEEMRTLLASGDEGKDISFPCYLMFTQYDARRKRREAEAEGLREGLALLQGAAMA